MFIRLILLLILLINFGFSKPYVQTNYKYYDIYPTNKHKLEDSMDKTSPISSFGEVRHGTVNWKIKYFYKRERRNGICSITAARTKVNILYHVPKIAKNHKSPKGTRSVFQRYYEVLKTYLKKHTHIAIEAADEIEKQLVKIKAINNDCNLIKNDAKKLAKAILTKYKKKNKDYEIRTYEGFLDNVRSEKLL